MVVLQADRVLEAASKVKAPLKALAGARKGHPKIVGNSRGGELSLVILLHRSASTVETCPEELVGCEPSLLDLLSMRIHASEQILMISMAAALKFLIRSDAADWALIKLPGRKPLQVPALML